MSMHTAPGTKSICRMFRRKIAAGKRSSWRHVQDASAGDVVLWYVFGIHHITRPEDWPVMPADTVSFWLKPAGFFDRNPALDVPPGTGHGAVRPPSP